MLCAIIHAAFASYRNVLVPPSGAHTETPETIAAKLAHGGGLLAFIGDVPVAGVVYQPHETHMYLGRLAVLPVYRGRGIGQRLVEGVEARARTLGLPSVQLGVRLQLPGNQTFFERLGYRVIRAEAHAGSLNPTCYYMEKRL